MHANRRKKGKPQFINDVDVCENHRISALMGSIFGTSVAREGIEAVITERKGLYLVDGMGFECASATEDQ